MASTNARRLVCFRQGRGSRIVGTLVLVGAMIFGVVTSELMLRDTALRCAPVPATGSGVGEAACVLVERWPLLTARETPLSPVVGVRTRANGKGNVALLLEHRDRTVSTHLGVGARGERAETVALQLRDHLAGSDLTTTFDFRPPAPPVVLGLFWLGFLLAPMMLLLSLWSRVRIVRDARSIRVRVGRGALPARWAAWDGTPLPVLQRRWRRQGGASIAMVLLVAGDETLDLGISNMRGEELGTLEAAITDFLDDRLS